MKIRRFGAAGAALVAGALVLSACAETDPGDEVTTSPTDDDNGDAEPGDPSIVTVGWNQPFYSLNTLTDTGNATANANIRYLTTSGFNYYDDSLELVTDDSFGTYEVTSEDPLTVVYTVNEGVTYSDGTPVDAADLLLTWAGIIGYQNTDPEEIERDEETGAPIIEEDQIFFSSPTPGLALVSSVPEIGDDGRSVTFVYDRPFADWEPAFSGIAVPAHVVAKLALDITDAAEGKQAVIDAIQDADQTALAAISDAYREGFNYTSLPDDPDLYLSWGPYVISEFVEGQYLTVVKNEAYTGQFEGNIDIITVRYNEDPQALVQALQNGEIDLLSPQATADTIAALEAVDGIEVETGIDATYEHVDLIFNNGGPFDPATYGGDEETAKAVRQAFLLSLPRQEIVDSLIAPLNPDADIRRSFTQEETWPNYDRIVADNGSDFYDETDIELAQQLLADAGVETPVDVRLLYGVGNTRRENQYVLIAQSAELAGFNVIDGGDENWGTLLSTAQDTYDASLFGWQSTSTSVTSPDSNFRFGGPNNFGAYNNPEVNDLFDELQVETDPERQFEILLAVEQHLHEDAFGLPIFQHPGVTAWNSELTGVNEISLSPTIFYEFWNWEISS